MSLFDTLGYPSGALNARRARRLSESAERLQATAWTAQPRWLAVRQCSWLYRRRARLVAHRRNGRSMGFEKPFLSDVPVSRRRLAPRRDSALESLSFRRPSVGRRSAVAAFHAQHGAFRAVRAGCVDAAVRRRHPRSSCFGGLCVLGLFRRWRWDPAGAVLAALIFMLGGAASSRLQHTGMIISYSFFPAALWCLEIALERRSYWIRYPVRRVRRIDGARARPGRLSILHGSRRARSFRRLSIRVAVRLSADRFGVLALGDFRHRRDSVRPGTAHDAVSRRFQPARHRLRRRGGWFARAGQSDHAVRAEFLWLTRPFL